MVDMKLGPRHKGHGGWMDVPISCILTVRSKSKCLKCESGSSCFQPAEGPSRGLLRDCEIFVASLAVSWFNCLRWKPSLSPSLSPGARLQALGLPLFWSDHCTALVMHCITIQIVRICSRLLSYTTLQRRFCCRVIKRNRDYKWNMDYKNVEKYCKNQLKIFLSRF